MKIQRRSNKPVKNAGKAKKHAGGEAFTLKVQIESPPLVAFGPPDVSSGALLFGRLELFPRTLHNALVDTFKVAKLEMKLIMEITTKRPIRHNCPDCTIRSKAIHTWEIGRAHV